MPSVPYEAYSRYVAAENGLRPIPDRCPHCGVSLDEPMETPANSKCVDAAALVKLPASCQS